MYGYDGGSIMINGTPIEAFPNDRWREEISVVRQNPYVFNETLWYNLTVGNRAASREAVEEVCEVARVTEFVDELEDGYETVLGDDGVQLSGGQRQRVALARALLKDTELLILDEATSDLDTRLEQQVQANIEEMADDYTIITIAHRLSTVRNADRIYTVEDGRVVEEGRHTDLIERAGSYAELYQTQQTHR
jgi:subfamily B ATP-binding cassette protein MsbA